MSNQDFRLHHQLVQDVAKRLDLDSEVVELAFEKWANEEGVSVPRKPTPSDSWDQLGRIMNRALELADELKAPVRENPVSWLTVVHHLIEKHEPDMKLFPKSPGAKKTALSRDLVIFLELLGAKSARTAALHLSKRKQFSDRTPEGIRSRFNKLKKPGTPENKNLRDYICWLSTRERMREIFEMIEADQSWLTDVRDRILKLSGT